MSRIKIASLCIGLVLNLSVFAQPSDSELKTKVNTYYKNSSEIVSIKFDAPKIEKRWERDGWNYYWSKHYNIKTKTEYPGVYLISYGGVQYHKNGNSYSYDRILTGAPMGYEGIPNPSTSEINTHLKSTYDPLNFYNNYLMNYLIKAPNTIKLAADPQWKWKELNVVSFNVETTFTRKTNDIGAVEEQKGLFRINLERSIDGKTFDPEAKLLKNGKWLPLGKGSKKKIESIKKYVLTKDELALTKTLAQQNATRHAEEFKKSLSIVKIPEFKSGNHLMMFTHNLLLEGDEAKVTAFMYQMFPRNYFEEWSDIVLNQNGERMLAEATEDLINYKKAFCEYSEIKEIGANYVRFYDRSKYRFNKISIAYENNRWYITDIGYTIREEDFAKHEQNGDNSCDGDPIYIDGEAQFKTGDKVLVLERGTWFNGEILKPEMEKGGYSVKYGRSGLLTWKFVSEVKADPEFTESSNNSEDPFIYEINEKVNVLYTGTWYVGTTLKISYDKEAYLVDIPDRNIETWISPENLKKFDTTNKKPEEATPTNSAPKKNKPKIKVPKVKIKLR